jgi:hypothetical protein
LPFGLEIAQVDEKVVEGEVQVEDVEWYLQRRLPELSENGLQSGYGVREHLE